MAAILAQLIGGAAGGTVSGKLSKDADLGNIGNLIAGGIGGLGVAISCLVPCSLEQRAMLRRATIGNREGAVSGRCGHTGGHRRG